MSFSTVEKAADENLSQQICDLQIDEENFSSVLARTEKKVNMTLDDIIKMSRKNKARLRRQRRDLTRKRGSVEVNSLNVNTKPRQHADSRSSIRKGVLAPRRPNLYGHFSSIRNTAIGYSAVPMPNAAMGSSIVRGEGRRLREPFLQLKANGGRPFPMKQRDKKPMIRNLRTLDALFASMKRERRGRFMRGARVWPAPPAVAPNAASGNSRTTMGRRSFAATSDRFGGAGRGRSSQWRPRQQEGFVPRF